MTTALPYINRMHTVIETNEFLSAARKAGMTETERFAAVDIIAANPGAGDMIPGSGGCRKVRVAKEGMGKRGGYRVVTYFVDGNQPVFLLTVIAKSQKANLTEAQKAELKKGKGR